MTVVTCVRVSTVLEVVILGTEVKLVTLLKVAKIVTEVTTLSKIIFWTLYRHHGDMLRIFWGI